MRRRPGEMVEPLCLPALDGSLFALESLRGRRYMLAFFRFAACPFCNLRVHELVARFAELGQEFTIVAVFDSSLENLQRHASRHAAPFPVLADETRSGYRAFAVEHSVLGVAKAALMRMPSVLDAVFRKGYFPATIQGDLASLPAEFLVDEQGWIRQVYYGKDVGDHMPFEQVKAFAVGGQD